MVALAQPADRWPCQGLPTCAPIGWACGLVVGCPQASIDKDQRGTGMVIDFVRIVVSLGVLVRDR